MIGNEVGVLGLLSSSAVALGFIVKQIEGGKGGGAIKVVFEYLEQLEIMRMFEDQNLNEDNPDHWARFWSQYSGGAGALLKEDGEFTIKAYPESERKIVSALTSYPDQWFGFKDNTRR